MPKSFDIKPRKMSVVDLRRFDQVSRAAAGVDKVPAYFRPAKADFMQLKKRPKKSGSRALAFFLVLLFLLVAASTAGFFVFYKKGPTGKSLNISLAIPEQVTAGQDFIFELLYENYDKVALNQIEIVIEYPENFYLTKTVPEPINEEKNVWQLEPLQPGQSGKIEVTGYLLGELKEEPEFNAFFHYRPENFNSDFQESASQAVTIRDSLLKVELESPEVIEDGAVVKLKVRYQNNSPQTINDLALAFELGEAFKINATEPEAEGTVWRLPEVAPGQSGEAMIEGEIDSTLANPLEWNFIATAAGSDSTRHLYKKSGRIEIKAPKVLLNLSAVDGPVSWGGEAEYKIAIENNGEIEINQAVLKLSFLNGYIDWKNFNNNDAVARVDAENNSLVWLSTSGGWTESLAQIKPGDKIEFVVKVPLESEPEDLMELSAEDLVVEAIATLSFKSQDRHKVFSSEKITTNIASQLKLMSEARYYLDAETKVGSGPLPPTIGQTTAYRIYWKIFSGSKELDQLTVKTTLPAYSSWQADSGQVTIGSPLTFDAETKEAVWQVDSLAANSQVMASFDVAVTPDASQVNQLLILTNPVMLRANIKESGQPLSQTNNLLTSDLIFDPWAQGQGRVIVGQD